MVFLASALSLECESSTLRKTRNEKIRIMKIKILDFTNGETNFATDIGAGLAITTTAVQIGDELDAELRIDTVYQWQKDIDFAVESSPRITLHDGQTEITGFVESIDAPNLIILRLNASGTLMVEVENLPADLALGSLITLRTDLLELFPFQL